MLDVRYGGLCDGYSMNENAVTGLKGVFSPHRLDLKTTTSGQAICGNPNMLLRFHICLLVGIVNH